MRIQLNDIWANAHGIHHPGKVMEVPDHVGNQLVSGRHAVSLETPEPVKAPTKPPIERPETRQVIETADWTQPEELEQAVVGPTADVVASRTKKPK